MAKPNPVVKRLRAKHAAQAKAMEDLVRRSERQALTIDELRSKQIVMERHTENLQLGNTRMAGILLGSYHAGMFREEPAMEREVGGILGLGTARYRRNTEAMANAATPVDERKH